MPKFYHVSVMFQHHLTVSHQVFALLFRVSDSGDSSSEKNCGA